MNNIKAKRIIAYFIDLIIIFLLITLLSHINFLNPYHDKYNKTLIKYTEYSNELQESISNSTVNDIMELIDEEYIKYMYDLQYYGLSYTLIEGVTIILYFTLFPKFYNNQTIGKRICKIKVVNSDGTESVPAWKHFLRSLLIPIFSNIFLYTAVNNLLNIIFVLILKEKAYFYYNVAITYILCIVCYADIIRMFVGNDNVSFHDKMTRTKVITC